MINGTRMRVPAAITAAAATLCATLGWTTPANPRARHDSDIVDPDWFAHVLADDAHHFGQHQPGRDYHREADQLTPILVEAMRTVTAAEIAGLHQRL